MPKKYSIRKKGKTRLGILVLGLIILLLLIAQIVNIGRAFFSPWNTSKIAKSHSWDGRFNINLVIKAKSLAVLSVNPIKKEATVINFPDNTLMDVANGFGKWEIRSVYNLGGWELLEQTVSGFLGVPIDGFLEFKNRMADKNTSEIIKSGVSDIGNIQTSLTPIELIRLKYYLTQVRFDKVKSIDLVKKSILEQSKLNDGTVVYRADNEKLDSNLTNFVDQIIKDEHATIAIYNATTYPQMAQRAARLITNLGGNVIITGNAENLLLKTQVVGKKSATMDRLVQIFDLGCRKDPECDRIGPDVEVGRAQINVFLGEDFYKDW